MIFQYFELSIIQNSELSADAIMFSTEFEFILLTKNSKRIKNGEKRIFESISSFRFLTILVEYTTAY